MRVDTEVVLTQDQLKSILGIKFCEKDNPLRVYEEITELMHKKNIVPRVYPDYKVLESAGPQITLHFVVEI